MSRTFDERYAQAAQEMKRLYMSLYHDEHAYYDGQKLLALLNFSTSEQTASTDGQGCLTNLCSGEAAGDTVRLLPCGFVWLAASAQA